ncbi:hypothetical protein BJV78DRAFT_117549 [Lactifluus subvellereus]|nr:hypothetical protein BJV78DRAFT_117549 [Lactifluus subvellereus]
MECKKRRKSPVVPYNQVLIARFRIGSRLCPPIHRSHRQWSLQKPPRRDDDDDVGAWPRRTIAAESWVTGQLEIGVDVIVTSKLGWASWEPCVEDRGSISGREGAACFQMAEKKKKSWLELLQYCHGPLSLSRQIQNFGGVVMGPTSCRIIRSTIY